jgi:hypothetical protein
MAKTLFDSNVLSEARDAVAFLAGVLEASTEPREIRKAKLFDRAIVGNAQEAVDFIGNILESSTEYSIIGKNRCQTLR